MPRLTNSTPKYRHHRGTGQAVVTVDGKDFYLGKHGTAASKSKYARLINERVATGRIEHPEPSVLTVVDGRVVHESAGVRAR